MSSATSTLGNGFGSTGFVPVLANGRLVLGHKQEAGEHNALKGHENSEVKVKFDRDLSFSGRMSQVLWFPRRLDPSEISMLGKLDCEANETVARDVSDLIGENVLPLRFDDWQQSKSLQVPFPVPY